MIDIDQTSFLVACSVDEDLSTVEKRLNRSGLTLGYRPLKRTHTLRQALEGRIPNRDALRYGGIDDLCVSLEARRGQETIITRNVPRAATGPDFKKILIGSGRRYARLIKATLRIHPLPELRETVQVTWKEKGGRNAFLLSLWGSGIRPVRFRSGPRDAAVVLEGSKKIVLAEKKCLEKLVHQTRGRMKP